MALSPAAPSWIDVRHLDLAQQALEEEARRFGFTQGQLPPPEALDLTEALEAAARRAQELLELGADARGAGQAPWSSHCLRRCPHRCFGRPRGAPEDVWGRSLPGAVVEARTG